MALLGNMDRIWATEVLRDRGGSLKPDALFRVTLLATGDEAQAHDARERRALEEMRRRAAFDPPPPGEG